MQYKNKQMLYKLKQTVFIILSIWVLNSCQTRKATTSFRKSKQGKEQLKKDKKDLKKKEEYNRAREKEREKHYNRQAASTKTNWDLNKQKSKYWIKNQYHKKSLGYKIKKFFEIFKREPIPKEGLSSKKQQKRKKKNIFQHIFKRDKKKKRK